LILHLELLVIESSDESNAGTGDDGGEMDVGANKNIDSMDMDKDDDMVSEPLLMNNYLLKLTCSLRTNTLQ
jgi:hypothetical protein